MKKLFFIMLAMALFALPVAAAPPWVDNPVYMELVSMAPAINLKPAAIGAVGVRVADDMAFVLTLGKPLAQESMLAGLMRGAVPNTLLLGSVHANTYCVRLVRWEVRKLTWV